MKVTKAIIPAAGLGTRVLPASKSIPKEMLPIVDKPAIQYIVEEAVQSGITDILIITNRGKSPMEDHFDRAPELEDRLLASGKTELYDEIVQGYESGTREIYVTDENGTHKLTKDEELSNLDAAYKKTVDDFVTMETTNQHARGIIGEEMNKISKITTRSTLASAYIEEQKTRGKDEITENLGKKMYGAITSFKEKYTMIQPNREQLLMSIKI